MKYLASCLAALVAGPAWAHDALPSANWCQYGQTAVVTSFAFTGADVDAYIACVASGACPDPRPPNQNQNTATCNNLKSCGNFDDDYGKTALMINAYCEQYADAPVAGRGVPAAPLPGYEAGSVAPIAYGPQFFLSTFHHSRYAKSQGVQGVCAKCVLSTPVQNNPGN
ncbi:MAG TPA: hypothetical protein VM555_01670 [Tahibacter sp.]|nr:hypothetical protein [Tahibacter sp.]